MQLTGSWHHTGLVPDPSRGKGQALGNRVAPTGMTIRGQLTGHSGSGWHCGYSDIPDFWISMTMNIL